MINPQQDLSRLKEAEAYIRYGQTAYARALYETILRERPSSRQAAQGLVALLLEMGDTIEATKQLERFRDITSIPLDRAWAEEELRRLTAR
jgi:tetratricopeptide (TPR) repeat protein